LSKSQQKEAKLKQTKRGSELLSNSVSNQSPKPEPGLNSATAQPKMGPELLFSINAQCILAECALWNEQDQSIYWVDIIGAKIQRCNAKSHAVETFAMPYRIGCFSFTPIQNEIIAAFDIGIARYNLVTEELEWLAQPEIHLKTNRFNDGRTDRQGRFWAGTMNEAYNSEDNDSVLGKVYCFGLDKQCKAKIPKVAISNGLCWSADGKTVYHADSPKRTINAYDFDTKTAELSNRRVFAQTQGHRFPDGSIVDAHDCLWNAQWGASQVIRYNVDGSVDLALDLPVSQPSSVAIGGPNMDWLIVTTARHSLASERLAAEPQAGNIFVYQLHGVTGIAEPLCLV
jgi:L-arabinonolactonase